MTDADLHSAALRGPRVVTLAYDGLCSFEFGISIEIFAQSRPEFGSDWYQHHTVAVEAGPLTAMGGLIIDVAENPALIDQADLIMVPGWRGANAPVPPTLIQALQDAHKRGARIASICSGAFVLAAAGLLDGRQAVTHWRYTQQLQQRCPDACIDEDVLFTIDDRVMTSAGSSAGLDLCLHIIQGDYGAEKANQVARRLVLPARRDGGQAQFIQRPADRLPPGAMSKLLDRLQAEPDKDWTIDRMARETGQSRRSFIRHFEQATGDSPARWLQRQRIDEACRLLETTTLRAEDIGYRVGYKAAETFRYQFRRLKKVTPTRWRSMYAGVSD